MIRGSRRAVPLLALVLALAAPAAACAAAVPLELVSGGASGVGGNGPHDACDVSIQCLDFEASADGSSAFFATAERLASTDADDMKDVYERRGAAIVQVSTGLSGGNGNFDATLQGISADGTRALFGTYEPLTRDDLDLTSDVYERGAEVRLVSTGPATGNMQIDVCEAGSTSAVACYGLAGAADGDPVFFTTPESLTFDDLDVGCFSAPARCADVYQRRGDRTTLVSSGTGGVEGAALVGVSRDGSRAFFTTRSALSPADTDAALDLYERTATSLKLVSAGTVAGAPAQDVVGEPLVSADGARVVFATAERLVAADTDSAVDLYERAADATALISGAGPGDVCHRYEGCRGVAFSDDGARVLFESPDRLVPADTDNAIDVYERAGGQLSLISGGGGAGPVFLDSITPGGSHVFVTTAERLVAADTDAAVDVYERAGGATRLVSAGSGALPAALQGSSAGGSRVVYATVESLTAQDTDEALDLYVSAGGTTTLLSGGSAGEEVVFLDMAEDGSKVFFATRERLTAADSDGALDIYAADLSGLSLPPEDPPDPPADPPAEPPTDPVGRGVPGSGGTGMGSGSGQASSPPGAGAAGAHTGAPPAAIAAFGKRLKASASGSLALRVSCTGPGSCRGRVLVESRDRRVARKSFSLRGGQSATVRAKLSRKARAALARGRRLKANVVVQTLDGAGALTSSSLRAVIIRAAKQKRR